MNFDSVIVDTDAWKGTGTVSGVHTHSAPIVLTTNSKLASAEDQTSTLEVLSDKVVVEKDLLVKGTLIAPGFTPGNPGTYPPNPTFSDVTFTHSSTNMGMTNTAFLHVTGPAAVDGVLTAEHIKLNDIDFHDGVVQGKQLTADHATITGSMRVVGQADIDTVKMDKGQARDFETDTLASWTTCLISVTDEAEFKDQVTFDEVVTLIAMTNAAFLHVTGPATVDGVFTTSKVKANEIETDTLASQTSGLIYITDEAEFKDQVTFDNKTTFKDEARFQNHIDGTTAGFQEVNTYTSAVTFLKADVLSSNTEGSKIQVADQLNFQQDVTSDKKITALDIVGTNTVGGGSFTPDSLTVENDAWVKKDLTVTGTATVHGLLAPHSLNVTTDMEGHNLHVRGNLTVDGTNNIPVPSHIYPTKITLNHDYTTGHQKTELTSNKITLEDTTVTGFADITLDGAEGTIKCNGGITCHNQYASTAEPAGVTCDYVNTLNVAIDTITGHRSDFGRNVAGESIYTNGQIESHSLKTTSIFGGVSCLGNWNFSGATVTGLPGGGGGTSYPSITEHNDYVQISKELRTNDIQTAGDTPLQFLGSVNFSNANVTGLPEAGYPSITEHNHEIEVTKNMQFENGIKLAHLEPLNDALMVTGAIDFAGATVTGLPHGTTYPAISEHPDYVNISKQLRASNMISGTELMANKISPENASVIFEGEMDFSNANVIGLPEHPGTSYPSITEESQYLKFDKPFGISDQTQIIIIKDPEEEDPDVMIAKVNGYNVLTITDEFIESTAQLRALKLGYDAAGIHFDLSTNKRIDMRLDDALAFSILQMPDTSTRTIDYSTVTLLNTLYVNSIHARPPNAGVNFTNQCTFEQGVTFNNHVDVANATVTGFTVVAGNQINLLPSPNNEVGIGTRIDDQQVQTQYVGMPNAVIYFDTSPPQGIYNKILGKNILSINDHLVNCARPFHTVSKSSSGNFTHCHLTEGSQAQIYEPGTVVTSTGEFCARDEDGILITYPKDTPSNAHAMCKVKHAVKGERALGIIVSNEVVANNVVNHDHGGITIRSPVQEQDNYKMLRVASSGDAMAWVVLPTFSEVDLPPLSGLWQKCTDDGYGSHTVLSNHVAIEAEEYLAIDNEIIDISQSNVIITATEVKVTQPAPSLTPNLFSGVYTKTNNGVTQPVNIVMVCNSDYSFVFSEHYPGIEDRINALEATIAELTGPD